MINYDYGMVTMIDYVYFYDYFMIIVFLCHAKNENVREEKEQHHTQTQHNIKR